VLFELIGMRYERRSLLITANQPFRDIFLRKGWIAGSSPAMTIDST
jgi:hypothetical protein